MKTKRKKFDRTRIIEFCKLVNAGRNPSDALYEMKSCREYGTHLIKCGIAYKVGDTWYAVERLSEAKYNAFITLRRTNNKQRALNKQSKQYALPLKPPQKKQNKQLNTIQKFIKAIFKL